MAARQQRFHVKVFLTPDRPTAKVNKSHLPEASGFQAPVTCPLPLLLSVKTVPPQKGLELDLAARGYLSCIPKEHFMGSECILTPTPGYDNLGTT